MEAQPKRHRFSIARMVWWVLLLTAIIIAAILLLPALEGDRHPQVDTCAMNLGQLARAIQLYAAENSGRLPQAGNWSDAVLPYVKGASFVCAVGRPERSGYALNSSLAGLKLADVRAPDQTVLLFESDLDWNGADGPAALPAQPRHRGGDQIAFVNGRVTWIKRGQAESLLWRPRLK